MLRGSFAMLRASARCLWPSAAGSSSSSSPVTFVYSTVVVQCHVVQVQVVHAGLASMQSSVVMHGLKSCLAVMNE